MGSEGRYCRESSHVVRELRSEWLELFAMYFRVFEKAEWFITWPFFDAHCEFSHRFDFVSVNCDYLYVGSGLSIFKEFALGRFERTMAVGSAPKNEFAALLGEVARRNEPGFATLLVVCEFTYDRLLECLRMRTRGST